MADRCCAAIFALIVAVSIVVDKLTAGAGLALPQISCSPGTPLFDPTCFSPRTTNLDDCWETERCKTFRRKEEWKEPLITLQDSIGQRPNTAFWLPGGIADVTGDVCWVVHNCSTSRAHHEMPSETAFVLNAEAVDREPIINRKILSPTAKTAFGEDALYPVQIRESLPNLALVPRWPGVAIAKDAIVESNGRINVCGKRISWFREGQIADMARKRPIRCDVLESLRHISSQRAIKQTDTGKVYTVKTENTVFATSLWIWPTFSHAILDRLARLAPYLEFLKNHPDIKIHLLRYSYLGVVQEQGEKFNDKQSFSKWYELLGIDQDRLVAGNIRSNVTLFPATGPGPLNVKSFAVYSLAQEVKSTIQKMFPLRELSDTILVVRRGNDDCERGLDLKEYFQFVFLSQKLSSHLQAHTTSGDFQNGQATNKAERCVSNHRDLVAALQNRYHLPVAEFPSDGAHDLAEELFMWYSARVVIIPHGGAFGNAVAMRKDSIVIELGVTRMDTGKLIGWGRDLCNNLRIRHFMYYPDRGGKINEIMGLNITRFLSYIDLVILHRDFSSAT